MINRILTWRSTAGHTPTTNSQRSVHESVSPDHTVPLNLLGSWETEGFRTLLRNGIGWGLGEI